MVVREVNWGEQPSTTSVTGLGQSEDSISKPLSPNLFDQCGVMASTIKRAIITTIIAHPQSHSNYLL